MKLLFNQDYDDAMVLILELIQIQLTFNSAEELKLKSHNKSIVQKHLSIAFNSPQIKQSKGLWSFFVAFDIFKRQFLSKFCYGEENQRLIIINGVAKYSILNFGIHFVEELTFNTMQLLIDQGDRYSNTAITSSILEAILRNESNYEWCYIFNNTNQMKR